MKDRNYYIINAITMYRLLAAPVMVFLIFKGYIHIFKWLLPLSFFTDLVDGFLARKFKVSSVFGSRLDSLGDDLTVVAGITGIFVLRTDFIRENAAVVVILASLLVTQNLMALLRYGKISSFHTYLAKISAVLQGCFLILFFLYPHDLYWLFYMATAFTILDLIEESILVFVIREWTSDVKGLFWVLKNKRSQSTGKIFF
jgi:CDP-diacylglycerol--glycerol-3-phosphate 3-phosphatidyltransferase